MQPLRGLLVLFAAARAELRVPSAPTDALLEIVGGDSVEVAWAPGAPAAACWRRLHRARTAWEAAEDALAASSASEAVGQAF